MQLTEPGELQCCNLEHEATIVKLQMELAHKNEQLSFITDEKA